MKEFKVRFLCADESEYQGNCVSITAPIEDGYVGILADHSDMITIMHAGDLIIDTGSEKIEYAVTDGLLKVEDGSVLVLAFSAERPEEIDEQRARDAIKRAQLKIEKHKSALEYRQAQADLSRAMNRLKVKHRG